MFDKTILQEKELKVEIERLWGEVKVLRAELQKEQDHNANSTIKFQEMLR